jgi:tripartite-type tricarboxylate transporter receptor subunit TctC
VPSIVEAGYPDAVFRFWVGLSAPARTPPAIINKLHDATEKAVAEPGMKEKLANLGVEPEPMSVEAFDRFVKDDIAATLQLAKQAHIEPLD